MRAQLKIQTNSSQCIATLDIANKIKQLREIKSAMYALKQQEKDLKKAVQDYMQDSETLYDKNGMIIATWKTLADKEVINESVLRDTYPNIYQNCLTVKPGSRRFETK